MSLLSKAKAVEITHGNKSSYTDEEIELAMAWVRGEISLGQLHTVKKFKSSNQAYVFVARALRQEMMNGKK